MSLFTDTEWNEEPKAARVLADGRVIVAKDVVPVATEEGTVYRGKSAVMTAEAYYAYAGAQEAEKRRENEIIDDYTQELIEGGVL